MILLLRVRAEFSGWSGGPGISTFYFLTPTEDATAAARVAERVRAVYGTHWKTIFPNSVSFGIQTDVDSINPQTGQITNTLTITAPTGWVGTGGAAYAPIAAAVLMRLSTNTFLNGRRVRGRVFFSPVTSVLMDADGSPSSGALTAVTGGGAAMLSGMAANDYWVVWHRPKTGSDGSTAVVAAVTCPDKYSILRSRRD